jgi:hypothetical protein
MRLRELLAAEVSYLIVNGWARYRIRDRELWYHPTHCPKDNGLYLTQVDAINHQKARDQGTAPIVHVHEPAPEEEPSPDTERSIARPSSLPPM